MVAIKCLVPYIKDSYLTVKAAPLPGAVFLFYLGNHQNLFFTIGFEYTNQYL